MTQTTPMIQMPDKVNYAFLGEEADKQFLPLLKPLFKGLTCYVPAESFKYLTEVEIYCKKRQVTKVVTTQLCLLQVLVKVEGEVKNPSIDNYAGSLFNFRGIEILIISPLAQLTTTSTGKFITSRFLSKLTEPAKWREATEFKWKIGAPENIVEFYALASSPDILLTAIDIETVRKDCAIKCVNYTVAYIQDGILQTRGFVLPIESPWAVDWMRKLNLTKSPKVFQNGKYDNIYFLRFNAPVYNWIWDTAHFMHAWLAELPKDLGFINAFFLRKVVYWKDLAETNDLHEYYRYNAMDGWATANVMMSMIMEAPDWAKRNYQLSFPLVFPCLLAEGTGIERDMDRLKEARKEVIKAEQDALSFLCKVTGTDFNPGSYIQVRKLLKALTGKDQEESDETHLNKIALMHPLNAHIIGKILEVRGQRKLRTNYLRTDDDQTKTSSGGAKEFRGRILYSINPHGTETGRNASRESAFWCGLQIQNIPRSGPVKYTLKASADFFLFEADLEQAESRDTANITGDKNLIEAVSGKYDFHSYNAAAFFGVPYSSIYDEKAGKVIDKALRTLGKPVNHGANYNMGPAILVNTMGTDKVWEAKKLLKLPFTSPLEIAEALLVKFHMTYPGIRGPIQLKHPSVRAYYKLPPCTYKLFSPDTYYASVAREVSMTGRITSRAYHHTEWNLKKNPDVKAYIEQGDWVRQCFGDPERSKMSLNSYVAHGPQGLNARTLNEAFMEVFYKVALPNSKNFRLHAQIHDSILGSYREGHEHLMHEVKRLMEIPVTVKDVKGNLNYFVVPSALKAGKKGPAIYWSDTE